MYMTAHVRTNPTFDFYFDFIFFWIFDFLNLNYYVEVTVRYTKLHEHYYQYKITLFFGHFLIFYFYFWARYRKIRLATLYQLNPITYDTHIMFTNCDSGT